MNPKQTQSPEETHTLGKTLATELQPGDVVLLVGDLGAGKTTFVQGMAERLGATVPVTSPSFVVINEYPLPRGVLRHIDLYRLPDPSIDIDRIGLPELLNDPEAITVVEWADRMPAGFSLPERLVRVKLMHGRQEGERMIEIQK